MNTMDLRKIVLMTLLAVCQLSVAQYQPTWDSLDSRPLPDWFDKAKVGIFIHWSVNSVPAFAPGFGTACRFWQYLTQENKEVVQYFQEYYGPQFTYQDFGPMFKADLWNPNEWASLFKKAGAKYVVFVSKHHEGWNNWKSKYQWGWNSVDEGPKRDIVGDLAAAIRNTTDLHFGIYHSLMAFYNPDFLDDLASNFTSRKYPVNVAIPQLKELVTLYKPELIWSDGVKSPSTDNYWGSKEFLAWLYNESPVKDYVVVNDRWGTGDLCKHGGYLTCGDRFNPRRLQKRKWEGAFTIDTSSWCYKRNEKLGKYMSSKKIIKLLVEIVSCGGNFLIDIGPSSDGMIPLIFQERLLDMGAWLEINGEAIYESSPWRAQNDSVTEGVWYTSKKNASGQLVVYAHVLDWPIKGKLILGSPTVTEETEVTMLGVPFPLPWTLSDPDEFLIVNMGVITFTDMPNLNAWTLKLSNVS